MIEPFVIEKPNTSDVTMDGFSINLDIFTGDGVEISATPTVEAATDKKKKKKELFSSPAHMDNGPITDNTLSSKELPFLETDKPYDEKYAETNNILKSAIGQIDVMLGEINTDIEQIRASKVLKRKYDYLAALQGTMGTFLSNKISAARELNNTITKCQDFELKRYKEVKNAAALLEQDEDKRVMEMYKAYLSTPVSARVPLGPSMLDMTSNNPDIYSTSGSNTDLEYAQYQASLTPQQNMMRLDSNPDIKQVVVYNQETGGKYFEIMNMATHEVVPNVETHDPMFLDGVTIDQQNMIARNVDLGETYPLVIVGRPLMNEY